MQGMRSGGPHEAYRDPERRRALYALLDDGFPKLTERVTRAVSNGFRWEDYTEPFIAWEGAQPIAHVGVLAHRVMLAGEVQEVAGIHAVVTRHDRRRRGLARGLLTEALAWIDGRWATSKLGTDLPAVYAPHGFRAFELHRFHVAHQGGEDRGRPLRANELERLYAACAARTPVSNRFASLDPGWLVVVDLAIQRRALSTLTVFEELGVIADLDVREGVLRVHELIARDLPKLEDLLRLAPRHDRVELYFCPDRLAPDARPEALHDGVWMARGRWPVDGPVGISRLAEH